MFLRILECLIHMKNSLNISNFLIWIVFHWFALCQVWAFYHYLLIVNLYLGCQATGFSRSAALDAHISEIHQDNHSSIFSLLRPLWVPSHLTTLQQPPDLPASIPAEILTGACGTWKDLKLFCKPRVFQIKFPPASPKKNSRLVPFSGDAEHKGPHNIIFADLIKESDKDGRWIGDLHGNGLIQGKGICIDTSRPQHMFARIHKQVLPQTILYEAFEQRVEALEKELEERVRLD